MTARRLGMGAHGRDPCARMIVFEFRPAIIRIRHTARFWAVRTGTFPTPSERLTNSPATCMTASWL